MALASTTFTGWEQLRKKTPPQSSPRQSPRQSTRPRQSPRQSPPQSTRPRRSRPRPRQRKRWRPSCPCPCPCPSSPCPSWQTWSPALLGRLGRLALGRSTLRAALGGRVLRPATASAGGLLLRSTLRRPGRAAGGLLGLALGLGGRGLGLALGLGGRLGGLGL